MWKKRKKEKRRKEKRKKKKEKRRKTRHASLVGERERERERGARERDRERERQRERERERGERNTVASRLSSPLEGIYFLFFFLSFHFFIFEKKLLWVFLSCQNRTESKEAVCSF